jgi:hypothetical protein
LRYFTPSVAARFTEASRRLQQFHDAASGSRRHTDTAERRRRTAALPRRGGSGVRPVGGAAHRGDRRLARLGDGGALPERHRQLHRTAVRGRDHGACLHAAERGTGRGSVAPSRGARRRLAPPRGGAPS